MFPLEGCLPLKEDSLRIVLYISQKESEEGKHSDNLHENLQYNIYKSGFFS